MMKNVESWMAKDMVRWVLVLVLVAAGVFLGMVSMNHSRTLGPYTTGYPLDKIVRRNQNETIAIVTKERDDALHREMVLQTTLSTVEEEKQTLEKEQDMLTDRVNLLQQSYDEAIQEKKRYIESVMEADVSVLRSVLGTYKKSLDRAWKEMVSSQQERGILVVAGEPKYMMNAFVSLWPVRHYWNSSLPVTVFYWGRTEHVTSETKAFFDAHIGNVSFIDLADPDIEWPAHQRDLLLENQESGRLGWVLKLAAAYFVPYQEVLYLDADSSPLADPDSLFSLSEYKKSGALFWPDTPCSRPVIFQKLIDMGFIREEDAPSAGEHETESGQWLLNRKMHREPLEYALAMGSHSDFTFSHAFGDKDLFRAGFALAGEASKYSLIPTSLGFAWSAAVTVGDNSGERTMRGYIQFSSQGEPLFHHRAGWKTKYEFDIVEERDLDAISSPLSCEWLRTYWPMEFPGVMSDDTWDVIQTSDCPYSIQDFHTAVRTCGSKFTGKAEERIPLFSIKGSHVEAVHKAMDIAWRIAVQARADSNDTLFAA